MKLVATLLLIFLSVATGLAGPSQPAIISDPDGFSYIRAEASKDSRIIATVRSNEEFFAEPSDYDWWRVSSRQGQSGFMHRSRVTLLTDRPGTRTVRTAAPAPGDSMPSFSSAATTRPQRVPTRYSVVGIADDDTLNVHSGPGMNYPIVGKLANGVGGIQVYGDPVMNGNDDWIHITFAEREGWTRPKYLSSVPVSSNDEASPSTVADSKATPSPAPSMNNGDDTAVKTAVVLGGAYLLYKLFTAGSSSGSDTSNSSDQPDSWEKARQSRWQADQNAQAHGQPTPYGY